MRRTFGRWASLFLLALTLLAAVFAACSDDDTPAPEGSPPASVAFPVTVTDSAGARVTFDSPPQRIAVLSPGHVEMLFAIGAGANVVAVDENTDFPGAAARLPKLSGFQPNLEAIGAARPDLVVITYDPGDLQSSLERLGIPVLVLSTPDSVAGILDQIALLGQITDQSRKADQLKQRFEVRLTTIRNRLKDVGPGPRVFHELDPALFTVCPGDFINDMYGLLKAQNIAKDAGLPCQMSQEAVIAADPEVIILADEPAGVTVDSVKQRAGWDSIAAVKQNAVYLVDADIFSRPGPRILDALEQLGELLYPEKFD